MSSKGEEDYEKIWEKLSLFNQQTCLYFCSFINEMTQESVVSKTKMDLKNLAIVFAPSVVVDYGQDPVISLKNVNFIFYLIIYLFLFIYFLFNFIFIFLILFFIKKRLLQNWNFS